MNNRKPKKTKKSCNTHNFSLKKKTKNTLQTGKVIMESGHLRQQESPDVEITGAGTRPLKKHPPRAKSITKEACNSGEVIGRHSAMTAQNKVALEPPSQNN
ncbi:hypothetical protein GWI33_014900 [Rhynchophorus ferrugineus]|uniref:Uncharacterized protein n=1 Tax=Rhynchophorus ferrugineus TaxID=354439 RepID=A0A834M534_RHYFE|nr:hypothetical protein GWI33_014900 [Rhynchophorus ferrugineus]